MTACISLMMKKRSARDSSVCSLCSLTSFTEAARQALQVVRRYRAIIFLHVQYMSEFGFDTNFNFNVYYGLFRHFHNSFQIHTEVQKGGYIFHVSLY